MDDDHITTTIITKSRAPSETAAATTSPFRAARALHRTSPSHSPTAPPILDHPIHLSTSPPPRDPRSTSMRFHHHQPQQKRSPVARTRAPPNSPTHGAAPHPHVPVVSPLVSAQLPPSAGRFDASSVASSSTTTTTSEVPSYLQSTVIPASSRTSASQRNRRAKTNISGDGDDALQGEVVYDTQQPQEQQPLVQVDQASSVASSSESQPRSSRSVNATRGQRLDGLVVSHDRPTLGEPRLSGGGGMGMHSTSHASMASSTNSEWAGSAASASSVPLSTMPRVGVAGEPRYGADQLARRSVMPRGKPQRQSQSTPRTSPVVGTASLPNSVGDTQPQGRVLRRRIPARAVHEMMADRAAATKDAPLMDDAELPAEYQSADLQWAMRLLRPLCTKPSAPSKEKKRRGGLAKDREVSMTELDKNVSDFDRVEEPESFCTQVSQCVYHIRRADVLFMALIVLITVIVLLPFLAWRREIEVNEDTRGRLFLDGVDKYAQALNEAYEYNIGKLNQYAVLISYEQSYAAFGDFYDGDARVSDAVAFSLIVQHADRATFEAEASQEINAFYGNNITYGITEYILNGDNQVTGLQPAAARPEYVAIRYLLPGFDPDLHMLDVASEPVRARTFNQSREQRRASITPRIFLLQDGEAPIVTTVVATPVLQNDTVIGFVHTARRPGSTVPTFLSSVTPVDLTLSLYDVTGDEDQLGCTAPLLFHARHAADTGEWTSFDVLDTPCQVSEANIRRQYEHVRSVAFGERKYLAVFERRDSDDTEFVHSSFFLIVLAAVFALAMLLMVIGSLLRSRKLLFTLHKSQQYVMNMHQRTKGLLMFVARELKNPVFVMSSSTTALRDVLSGTKRPDGHRRSISDTSDGRPQASSPFESDSQEQRGSPSRTSNPALRPETTEEATMLIENLELSTQRLTAIVNDILSLQQLEQGLITLELAPFQVDDIVNRVRSSFVTRASMKGLSLSAHVGIRAPAVLVGDKERIVQMLLNLTSNAVQFTQQGSIDITVDAINAEDLPEDMQERDAKLTAPNVQWMLFSVEDTGEGIAEELLPSLFVPYSSATLEIVRHRGGIGVGLSIVKTLAEAMGGCVRVHTRVGEGTQFRILVPLEVPRPARLDLVPESDSNGYTESVQSNGTVQSGGTVAAMRALPLNERAIPLAALRGDGNYRKLPRNVAAVPTDPDTLKSVLLVEDQAVNLRIIKRMVQRCAPNAAIDTATNGQIALDLALARVYDSEYDLVLMDVRMPVMTGRDAVRAFRARGFNCPIVAMTTEDSQEDRDVNEKLGFTDMLSKPFVFADVEDVLLRYGIIQSRRGAALSRPGGRFLPQNM